MTIRLLVEKPAEEGLVREMPASPHHGLTMKPKPRRRCAEPHRSPGLALLSRLKGEAHHVSNASVDRPSPTTGVALSTAEIPAAAKDCRTRPSQRMQKPRMR